jgi:hypothetical protein
MVSQGPVYPSSSASSSMPDDPRLLWMSPAMAEAYRAIGSLGLTEEQQRILARPFDDAQVDVLPTGELYINHMLIRSRLNEAFGIGNWALIPIKRRVDQKDQRIYVEAILLVHGKVAGDATGAAPYFPGNERQDYTDAVETALASCLRRIAAKHLGCGMQVWDPAYCSAWIKKHAEQYFDRRSNRRFWRKKGTSIRVAESGRIEIEGEEEPSAPPGPSGPAPVSDSPPQDSKSQKDDAITDAQIKGISARLSKLGAKKEEDQRAAFRAITREALGREFDSRRLLSRGEASAVIDALEDKIRVGASWKDGAFVAPEPTSDVPQEEPPF